MNTKILPLPLWLCFAMGFLTTCVSTSAALPFPKNQAEQLPAPTIGQMMKNVAWNELQATEHPAHYYRYIERTISPEGSRTSDEITTRHGIVDRLLEVNRHPPTAQQLQKNQQLLESLPGNVHLQQTRFEDQRNNLQRRDNVIKDMPAAFIYKYVGRDRHGLIMLKFRPNPNFQPTSRQSLILEGMAGEAWVDPKTQRIAKIDGKLIQDVKIGWGFFARLYKGGTFLLEQSQGKDGTWHQKKLSVHFDGTEFIFKHIHIHESIIRCCFEQVPDGLTIREAVKMIRTNTILPGNWKSRLESVQNSTGTY